MKKMLGGNEVYHCKCDNGKMVTAIVADGSSTTDQIDQACGGVSYSCTRG
ncbi:hypothetical protein [Chryseobacterium sp. FH2]|nr:hypothetical protein [Chryseobacterium sp. FH2]